VNNKPKNSRNQPPALPKGEVLATFKTHPEAAALVEKLIAGKFPAGAIAIVGSDLRSVERVRGKINYARMAIAGATTGAWVGLAYALLFGANPDPANLNSSINQIYSGLGSSIVIGAGIGMLANVIRYSLAKNKRTFIAQSTLVAAKYQVQVPSSLFEQAKLIEAQQIISE
jgi:hypothetical protein